MARVEDRSQSYTRWQWHNHYSVHLVIHDVSDLAKIDWVNNLVISIFLVAIQILGLTTMTWVVSISQCKEVRTYQNSGRIESRSAAPL